MGLFDVIKQGLMTSYTSQLLKEKEQMDGLEMLSLGKIYVEKALSETTGEISSNTDGAHLTTISLATVMTALKK